MTVYLVLHPTWEPVVESAHLTQEGAYDRIGDLRKEAEDNGRLPHRYEWIVKPLEVEE